MPDIGYSPVTEEKLQQPRPARRRWNAGRLTLIASIAAAIALAAVMTPPAEAARAVQAAGPELTRLLRAMAGLKLLFAAAALSATYWRLATPAPTWRLAAYTTAGAATAAGPVLIWQMAHIPLGAFLLHAGLLASALLLWRDPAVTARLNTLIAQRRALLRT
jgi:hypothetical protein